MKKKLLLFFTIFIGMLTITSPVFAYTKYLSVPHIVQVDLGYCGATAAKTNVNYEDINHSEFSSGDPNQYTIYDYIRGHNIENNFWHTDPRGLSYAIYNWTPSAHHYADWNYSYRTTAMHGSAWTIDAWNSPVELAIDHCNHWITLTGFQSSVSPYASPSTATIYGFWVEDSRVGSWMGPGVKFTEVDEWINASELGSLADPYTVSTGSHWYGKIVTVERDSSQGVSKYNYSEYANY